MADKNRFGSELTEAEIDACFSRQYYSREHQKSLGPVVQKPINANLRLKINHGVYFSTTKCCSTLILWKTFHYKKLILKNNNKQKKLSPKS